MYLKTRAGMPFRGNCEPLVLGSWVFPSCLVLCCRTRPIPARELRTAQLHQITANESTVCMPGEHGSFNQSWGLLLWRIIPWRNINNLNFYLTFNFSKLFHICFLIWLQQMWSRMNKESKW
jgi:hypothetical protein